MPLTTSTTRGSATVNACGIHYPHDSTCPTCDALPGDPCTNLFGQATKHNCDSRGGPPYLETLAA